MITLSEKESVEYIGGGKASIGLGLFFAALGSFILGFIDGFSNPKACNTQ